MADEELFDAVRDGDDETLEDLVEDGASVDVIDDEGYTLLQRAIMWSSEDDTSTIEALVFLGANVNLKNKMGKTALHVAAENGKTAAIKSILKEGGDAMVQDGDGKTPVECATGPASKAAFGSSDGPDEHIKESFEQPPPTTSSPGSDDFGGFEDDDEPHEQAAEAPIIVDDYNSDIDDNSDGGDEFGGFDDPPAAPAPKKVAAPPKKPSEMKAAKQKPPAKLTKQQEAARKAKELADQRWWVGKQSRAAANHAVLTKTEVGQFLVRQGSQPMTAVVVVNDHGAPMNIQVQIGADGTAIVVKKKYESLEEVIKTLRTTPQTSKVPGKATFIVNRPVRTPVAVEYNFMAFSQGQLKCRALPNPPKQPKAAVKKTEQRGDQRGEAADESKAGKSLSRKRSSFFRRKPKTEEVVEPTNAKWECPTYPVLRVAVAKRDAPGFGMTLVGPDKGGKQGVYVSKLDPQGPVARETENKVVPGMRLIALNGTRTVDSTRPEVVEQLKSSITAIMTLQLDPKGFAQYDGGALLKALEEEWEAKKVEPAPDKGKVQLSLAED